MLEEKIKKKERRFSLRKRGVAALGLGFLLNLTDCDDPGLPEPLPSGPFSENSASDGYISEDSPDAQDKCPTPYYEDKDSDGYGNFKAWVCEKLPGYVENNEDCNDFDQLIHPGVADLCGEEGDNLDNNCNGQVDEQGKPYISKGCKDNVIWWKDSCGKFHEAYGQCPENYKCKSGECVCVPNCSGKECGSDGCGGSCGGCGECEKCLSNGKCSSYTDGEIMNNCTITDSIGFSPNGSGHNLSYNSMESGEYTCPGNLGLRCNDDNCWAQWEMNVTKDSQIIILEVEGTGQFNGQIDNLPFGVYNGYSGSGWDLGCQSPEEIYLETTDNGINFTSDGKVILQFSKGYSLYYNSVLSYAQILSCTCPKDGGE